VLAVIISAKFRNATRKRAVSATYELPGSVLLGLTYPRTHAGT